jgi:hypothetical protein
MAAKGFRRPRGATSATRYAVVRDADGVVVNVIELAAGADWTAPSGHSAVADPNVEAEVGGTWDGASFAPAGAAPDPLTPKQRAAVDRLTAFVGNEPASIGAQASAFLALPGDATPTQLTNAVKALIRVDRAIATVLARVVREVREEE